jgi:hypothetical protein
MDESRYCIAKARLNDLVDSNISLTQAIFSRLKELVAVLNNPESGENELQLRDRQEIDQRIRGFDFRKSIPFQRLEEKGYGHLKFSELLSMSEVIAQRASLSLDRQAKRRKRVLFKWLADHWQIIEPHFERMEIQNVVSDESTNE